MKKTLSFVVLLVVAIPSFSQTTKVVLTGNAVLHVQAKNGDDSVVQRNAGEKLYLVDSPKLAALQNRPASKPIASGEKRTAPNKPNIDSLAKAQQQRTKDSLAAIALGGIKPHSPSTASILSVIPIIPILIFLALLAIAAFIAKKIQAKRIAKRDPIKYGPPMLANGMEHENAMEHIHNMAVNQFGPNVAIAEIVKGTLSGVNMKVMYNLKADPWKRVTFKNVPAYRALIHIKGEPVYIYCFEACGNPVKKGDGLIAGKSEVTFVPDEVQQSTNAQNITATATANRIAATIDAIMALSKSGTTGQFKVPTGPDTVIHLRLEGAGTEFNNSVLFSANGHIAKELQDTTN